MQKPLRRLVDLGIIVVVLAAGYWAFLHHNQILDPYYAATYTPPQSVVALADQASLSAAGRRLFYRARPQVDPDRAALVDDCHISGDKTIELGCYLTNDRIYLLDITEPDLSEQIAVTAAHETLHAAYDRLPSAEKKRIDKLLEQAYSQIRDPELTGRMADYAKTEPGQRDNELHSILGTEFGNLPPVLETYYSQYFTNRQQVVALSTQFTQSFDGLRAQVDQLGSSIDATKTRMTALLNAGEVSQYNQLVPVINADITTYNQKVDLYNRYADELLGQESTAAPQS